MSGINSEKGSVLVVVLGFVLAFTLLGIGSLYNTFVQNERAEREKASTEAFWAADGALELAAYRLAQDPFVLTSETGVLGVRANYNVASRCVCICVAADCTPENCALTPPPQSNTCVGDYGQVNNENWIINSVAYANVPNSDGTANNQYRRILAKYGSYDIENAITTHGTVNGSCGPAGSATIAGSCIPHDDFTFESIFGGADQQYFEDEATDNTSLSPTFPNQNFILDSSSDLWGIGTTADYKVTVIHLDNTFHNPTFNTDNSAEYDGSAAFLIVDTRGYTGGAITNLTINGNADYCGIIWTIGEVKVAGTAEVRGAIFIDGDPDEDTPFTGNADMTFDVACVKDAIPPGITLNKDFFYWKEY